MIWLSAAGGLSFGKQVRLDAGGREGYASSEKKSFASAGGSGGQILIFSGNLVTPEVAEDQPKVGGMIIG